MTGTSCTVRTAWDQTVFETNVGIRQGAVGSPLFFGSLVEWVVAETALKQKWESGISTYPDMPVTPAAHMDDLLIWDGTSIRVQGRLAQLQHAFCEWGLSINIAKCSEHPQKGCGRLGFLVRGGNDSGAFGTPGGEPTDVPACHLDAGAAEREPGGLGRVQEADHASGTSSRIDAPSY